jgi:hypothetical protein
MTGDRPQDIRAYAQTATGARGFATLQSRVYDLWPMVADGREPMVEPFPDKR